MSKFESWIQYSLFMKMVLLELWLKCYILYVQLYTCKQWIGLKFVIFILIKGFVKHKDLLLAKRLLVNIIKNWYNWFEMATLILRVLGWAIIKLKRFTVQMPKVKMSASCLGFIFSIILKKPNFNLLLILSDWHWLDFESYNLVLD